MIYYGISFQGPRHILAISDPVATFDALTRHTGEHRGEFATGCLLNARGSPLPTRYNSESWDFTICNLPLLAVSQRAMDAISLAFPGRFTFVKPVMQGGHPQWYMMMIGETDVVDLEKSAYNSYESGGILSFQKLVFIPEPRRDPLLFEVPGIQSGPFFCSASFRGFCVHHKLRGLSFKEVANPR